MDTLQAFCESISLLLTESIHHSTTMDKTCYVCDVVIPLSQENHLYFEESGNTSFLYLWLNSPVQVSMFLNRLFVTILYRTNFMNSLLNLHVHIMKTFSFKPSSSQYVILTDNDNDDFVDVYENETQR